MCLRVRIAALNAGDSADWPGQVVRNLRGKFAPKCPLQGALSHARRQHYNPLTGDGYGARGLGMSTLVCDWLQRM